MKQKKLIIFIFISVVAVGSAFFMFNNEKKPALAEKSREKIKALQKRRLQRLKQKKISKQRRRKESGFTRNNRSINKKAISSNKKVWRDIGNYPHKEKMIKHFSRFRKSASSSTTNAPPIELKLGKLIEKKQGKKTFSIREVLVSINHPKNPSNFIALVDEKTGRIIRKQGRRITDPFSKIGKRLSTQGLQQLQH